MAKQDEIALAERLTRIEAGQDALSQKIDLHHEALKLQLAPLIELNKTVGEHDRDIARWKGFNGAMALIATVTAAIFGKLHFWHS